MAPRINKYVFLNQFINSELLNWKVALPLSLKLTLCYRSVFYAYSKCLRNASETYLAFLKGEQHCVSSHTNWY